MAMPIITTSVDLTDEEMVRILTDPRNAIVKQFQALYKMDGIDLQFDEAALRAIGREAKKRPTGARALRAIVKKALRRLSFDAPSDSTIAAIRITEEAVLGTGEPVVVRSEKKETAVG